MTNNNNYILKPIGFIHSSIKKIADAPLFYNEDAPEVTLEVLSEFADALHLLKAGNEIIVITWLHLGDRSTLQVHPRGNKVNPLTGVFATRSPDRPNPLGLHRARILKINELQLTLDAMEAIDQTPVVDIKPVVGTGDE